MTHFVGNNNEAPFELLTLAEVRILTRPWPLLAHETMASRLDWQMDSSLVPYPSLLYMKASKRCYICSTNSTNKTMVCKCPCGCGKILCEDCLFEGRRLLWTCPFSTTLRGDSAYPKPTPAWIHDIPEHNRYVFYSHPHFAKIRLGNSVA